MIFILNDIVFIRISICAMCSFVSYQYLNQNEIITHFVYGSSRQRVVKWTDEPGATPTPFRPLTSYECDEQGRVTRIRPPNAHNPTVARHPIRAARKTPSCRSRKNENATAEPATHYGTQYDAGTGELRSAGP